MGFSLGDFLNPAQAINQALGVDLGDTWDSFTGKQQQADANAANVQMAREAMAFSERMSNTAHQRQVKDLEAAGINPILSAKLGGASSPGGIAAQVAPLPSATSKFVATAMDVLKFAQDRRATEADIGEVGSRTASNVALADKLSAEADALKGGWTGKVVGTDLSNFLRRVLHRMKGVLSEDFGRYKRSPEGKNPSGLPDLLKAMRRKMREGQENAPRKISFPFDSHFKE